MKKILLSLMIGIYCFGDNNLNEYLKSKEHLKSLKSIEVYTTNNVRESSIFGYNLISIYLKNKENNLINFQILKKISLIINKCDFKINKKDNQFIDSLSKNCNELLSKKAQQKHILGTIMSIEKQIEFVYNKGDEN